MEGIPETFWDDSVAANHPLALEPEGGGTLASLNYTKMGWGYACSGIVTTGRCDVSARGRGFTMQSIPVSILQGGLGVSTRA